MHVTDEISLTGQVAVVTGGGAGIGRATSRLFASRGATVVIAEIDSGLGEEVAKLIESEGGRARLVTLDVRDQVAVEKLRQVVLAEFGHIDILVNNVGHYIRISDQNFAHSEPSTWEEPYRVNLLHVFAVTHAFLPSMLDRRSGAIINVSSIEGVRGYPSDPVYGAFKAGVVHFTQCLGVQVAPLGVRVNGIAPDLVDTLQTPATVMLPPDPDPDKWRGTPSEFAKWPAWLPVRRFGSPEEQAQAILFLASPISSYIVGHTIPTDGGTAAAGGWYQSDRRPGRAWTNFPLDP
jgi:2-hydroxycyclohexanecarboxyl-CoA dehydrogenase